MTTNAFHKRLQAKVASSPALDEWLQLYTQAVMIQTLNAAEQAFTSGKTKAPDPKNIRREAMHYLTLGYQMRDMHNEQA